MSNGTKVQSRLSSLNDWQSAIDLPILAWRMTIQELGRPLKRALSHFAGKRFRGRMNAESNNSVEIDHLLKQLRAGELSAKQELIRTAQNRLVRLARKMLSDFPGVHRWEDTDDVFQDAVLRLCNTLDRVVPDSVTAFVQIAARDIRCALIDLARHYYGPQGHGTHHHSGSHAGSSSRIPDVADDTCEPTLLAYWSEFHRSVQQLPEELRDVMDIVWYQGLSQVEAATLLNISERTIQRRWRQACLELHDALNGLPPGFL